RTTVLGYSNGANFAAAVMLLHPGVIPAAALLRPVRVLERVPAVDLAGTPVVTVSGTSDPFAADAAGLDDLLRNAGARLSQRQL
ncbi:hypothetical protein ABTK02_21850, partial [Acinetobacter baumannii]